MTERAFGGSDETGDGTSLLVPVDLSAGCLPAVQTAGWLSRLGGGSVRLTYVAEPSVLFDLVDVDVAQLGGSLRNWATEQLGRLRDEFLGGLAADCEVVDCGDSVAESIGERARLLGVSLIVMGTHGRGAIEHAVVGSTATAVVRQAPCDVLTVRPPALDEPRVDVKLRSYSRTHLPFKHLMCPVDFSDGSRLALARALDLGRRLGARLDVVHVVRLPFWPVSDRPTLAQEVVASAEAAMTGLLAEHEHADLAVETHVIEGSAGARLVEFAAQRGADLLVMGTHGRTGLDRLVAGSVAERVVRSSLVPVWVVRAASGTV